MLVRKVSSESDGAEFLLLVLEGLREEGVGVVEVPAGERVM